MVARSLQIVDFYPIWHFKPFRQWWQNYLQLTLWSNKKKLIIDKLGKVPCWNRHLLFLVLWFVGSIRILKCCFLSSFKFFSQCIDNLGGSKQARIFFSGLQHRDVTLFLKPWKSSRKSWSAASWFAAIDLVNHHSKTLQFHIGRYNTSFNEKYDWYVSLIARMASIKGQNALRKDCNHICCWL